MKTKIFEKLLKESYGKINSIILNSPLFIKKPIINIISSIPFYHKYPKVIDIELTNACNLKCPLCPTTNLMKRKIGFISLENFKKIVDQLPKQVKTITLGYAGEMTLNQEFPKMISYARKKGFNVDLFTNGTCKRTKEIIESKPTNILYAMDGASKETQESYRIGSKFEEVLENLKNLVKIKKEFGYTEPKIILQFIVMKNNQHELKEIIKLAKEIGVDQLDLKPVSLYEDMFNKDKKELFDSYLPQNTDITRYKIEKKLKINKPIICPAVFSSLIYYNGDVSICCYDYDGIHKLGNVFEEDFKTIWKSKKYKNIRKMIIKKDLTLCKKCTMGIGGSITIKF